MVPGPASGVSTDRSPWPKLEEMIVLAPRAVRPLGEALSPGVPRVELERPVDEVARAVEAERNRLAADLHDGAVQRLTALSLRAHVTAGRVDDPVAAQQMRQIGEDLQVQVADLRALMARLQPPALAELGLAEALRDHADRFCPPFGVDVTVLGDARRGFDRDSETAAYRIAQEAIANAARHAAARRIEVRIEDLDGLLRITVADDGCGFDPEGVRPEGVRHFGLTAMRARANALGGTLRIRSTQAAGTVVVAELPRVTG
jgi:signal transduction histidine kinase